MAINPNYLGQSQGATPERRGLNVAIEQVLRSHDPFIGQSAHPLLFLCSGLNGRGTDFGRISLDSNVIRVLVDPTSVAGAPGILRTAQNTPTAARQPEPGVAAFVPAHYRDVIDVVASRKRLSEKSLADDRASRAKIYVENVSENFRLSISKDLSGSGPLGIGAPGENRFGSIKYPLSTTVTYGGIDMTLAQNVGWQSNVIASAGAFQPELLDQARLKVSRKKGACDCWLFSAPDGGIDIYARYKNQYRGAVEFVVNNEMLKVGIANIVEEGGAITVQDHWAAPAVGTAEIIGLTTSTWWYVGDQKQALVGMYLLPGTDTDEMVFNQFGQFICTAPGRNVIITGVL